MAVPRNRTSNAKKNSRRSHHAKTPKHFGRCSNCQNACLPHRMCPECGHYAKRAILAEARPQA